MAKFAVLITHREILGREPKILDLHAVLAKYQRREVIFLLSKLNCLLGTWQNAPSFDLDEKLSQIFLRNYSSQIAELRRANINRLVFSRITLLYLIKQTCIVCGETGASVDNVEAHADIGLACLMVNDLLLPFLPSDSDDILTRLANLLPFSDYIARDQYEFEIARSQEMFNAISQSPFIRARSDFIDLKMLFERAMGLSHVAFCELVFGCATKFLNIKFEDFASPEAVILRHTYFHKSAISHETVKQFLQKMTTSESTLSEKIRSSSGRPGDDFTLFQAFPLVEIAPNLYTCLDPGFLADKAGRGLYWTLFSTMPDEQKNNLASFWGAIFELYVNSILQQSYKAKGSFIPEPKFSNGDQAFDACLVEGRSLVVFEHKSSTLRADAKYGGEVAKLKQDLDLKFIKGDDEGAKGVAQLNRSLLRFLKGEAIETLATKDISTIYPCLVCLDNSVSVPYMGQYFREQFKMMYPRKEFRQTVTSVFTLNISDVENLLGYLEKFAMSDILDSYYRENRSMLTSLSSSEVPLLKGVVPGPNVVKDGFAKFGRKMEQDLFPNETAQASQ